MAKEKDKKALKPKKSATSRKKPTAPASSKKAAPSPKPAAAKAKPKPKPKPKAKTLPARVAPSFLSAETVTLAEPGAEMPKSHLSAKELEEFKQVLLIKRAQIQGDIQTLNKLHKNRQEATGDLSSVPFHPADAGSDTFEQDFTIGLMDNEQGMLREINEALDRIASGTYGICIATHRPISKARLQATPWAKFCIEYARLLEKGQAPRYPGGYRH